MKCDEVGVVFGHCSALQYREIWGCSVVDLASARIASGVMFGCEIASHSSEGSCVELAISVYSSVER